MKNEFLLAPFRAIDRMLNIPAHNLAKFGLSSGSNFFKINYAVNYNIVPG